MLKISVRREMQETYEKHKKIADEKKYRKKRLFTEEDYRGYITFIVRRIDALRGEIDDGWLCTYVEELIIKHREYLPHLKRYMEKLEKVCFLLAKNNFW